MQDNKYTPLQRGSAKLNEITAEQVRLMKEENQKLVEENIQLKKSLEDEQFLHSNLYKEWKELKETLVAREFELRRYNESSGWIFSRPAFYCLLGLTLILAIFTLYNLYISPGDKHKILSEASTPVAISNLDDSSSDPGLLNTNKSLARRTGTTVNGNNTGLYKIKSKAYLYNKPDSSTRRKAFIVHWNNRYTTLKALDDRNDFIYVMFTNNKGQTSKGWLRKFDLYSVEEK